MGDGPNAEWLGSIPWDGYPEGIGQNVFTAETEDEYRNAVSLFLTNLGPRSNATLPDQGWPWPWNNSGSTQYAYAWIDERVWASSFGLVWFLVQPKLRSFGNPDQAHGSEILKVVVRGLPDFPDMRDRRRHRRGRVPAPRISQEG